MMTVSDPKENPFKGSTVFSRQVTVVQGILWLCHDFSSSDQGDQEPHFWIASSYEAICKDCFSECKSLVSVTFDADSTVSRFDAFAFSLSGLTSIYIPSFIEVICEYCFYQCESLASVAFDVDSKVSRFDCKAFSESGLTSIHIHLSVEMICESYFSKCKSLASVLFDPTSKCHGSMAIPFVGVI
jgi:hypothetical protein